MEMASTSMAIRTAPVVDIDTAKQGPAVLDWKIAQVLRKFVRGPPTSVDDECRLSTQFTRAYFNHQVLMVSRERLALKSLMERVAAKREELLEFMAGAAARFGLIGCPHGEAPTPGVKCNGAAGKMCRRSYLASLGEPAIGTLMEKLGELPYSVDLLEDLFESNKELPDDLREIFDSSGLDTSWGATNSEYNDYDDGTGWHYDDESPTSYLYPNTRFPICIDDGKMSGVVKILTDHMAVWTSPCTIRFADIYKKTSAFLERRPQVEYNLYSRLRPIEKSRRHYALPLAHIDDPTCTCMFCVACQDTVGYIEKAGFTQTYLAECITKTICDRTRDLLVAHVKLIFQEVYTDLNLDERICYGFRDAVPVVGCVEFEQLFKEMYKVGSHVVWEITQKLATFVKYTASYQNCLHFIQFFLDVSYRMAEVVKRLAAELDFFDWKLNFEHKISLKIFFLHIFDSHLYRSHEFQELLVMCCKVIFKHRKHQLYDKDAEMSTKDIKRLLNSIQIAAETADATWKAKKEFPFKFDNYVPLKHNIFKIAPLLNPFEILKNNQTFGYEVVLSRSSGQFEYQNLGHCLLQQVTRADAVLDMTIAKPNVKGEHFAIRVYREALPIHAEEMGHMVRSKDGVFINSHGYRATPTRHHEDYLEGVYTTQRNHLDLDTYEGPLPPQVEKAFAEQNENLDKCTFFDPSKGKANIPPKPAGIHRKKVDRTWPSRSYTRKRRLSVSSKQKKNRNVLKKIARSAKCPLGSTCVNFAPGKKTRQFDYALGGVPEEVTNPEIRVADAKNFHFLQDILGTAIQLGSSCLNPDLAHPGVQFRYFVVFTYIITDQDEPIRPKVTSHTTDAIQMIRLHYDSLLKHDVLTFEDCKHSPHQQERIWSAHLTFENRHITEDDIQARIESIKETRRPVTPPPGSQILPEHIEATFNEAERRMAEANLRDIRTKSGVASFCRRTTSDGSIETRTAYACHTSAGTSGDHSHAPQAHSHDHRHNQTHIPTHPPGPCPNANPQTAKPAKCVEHEKKSNRPGLPVSAGYTERRNTLRQKLAREKKEKEELKHTDVDCDGNGNHQCGAVNVKKTAKQDETGTVPVTPLNTEKDIDALVDIIEGVKNVTVSQQHRNSSASESNDLKKAAKKARKREKKEQKRQEEEEEAKKQELEKELENELLQTLAEKRKELEITKLEKKKGGEEKQNAEKKSLGSQSGKKLETNKTDDKKIEVRRGSKDGANTDSKKNEEKKGVEAKRMEEKKVDPKKASTKKVEDKKLMEDKPESKKQAEKGDDNPKPDMVTIRRHATAPDTTVTISVKSDTGEEDVLYTLVNGQVLKTDKKADIKSNGSQHPTSSKGTKNGSTDKKESVPKPQPHKNDDKTQSKNAIKSDATKEHSSQPVSKKKGSTSSDQAVRNDRSVLAHPKPSNAMEASSGMPAANNEFFMLRDEKGNDVDITQVKLPPGITVTRIRNSIPVNGGGSVVVADSGKLTSFKGNLKDNYGRDVNEIDEFYFPQRDTGAFEEVVSNKTRRQRNKENKGKEGPEIDEQLEAHSMGKRWGSEYSNSSDNHSDTYKAPSGSSQQQPLRGKRTFDGHVGDSMTFENSRYRKTSGSTGHNRTQGPSQGKHGAHKSQHTGRSSTPKTHHHTPAVTTTANAQYQHHITACPEVPPENFAGAFRPFTQADIPNQITVDRHNYVSETPKLPNGRGKMTSAGGNIMPRLNRPVEVQDTLDGTRGTNSPAMRTTNTFIPPMAPGAGKEYFQPIFNPPGPTPHVEARPIDFSNGQQNSANFTVDSRSEFHQYNPWGAIGANPGQNTDFLGNLLKGLNVRESQEAPNPQFGYGYGTQFPSDNSKPWNYTPHSPQTPSSDSFQGMSMFNPVAAGVSPSPIGSNRPQSCDLGIGYPRGSFGDNSSTSTSVAIQRPSASPGLGPMRNQFMPPQAQSAFKYYDRGPYDLQTVQASAEPPNAGSTPNYTRPNDAEYSLF